MTVAPPAMKRGRHTMALALLALAAAVIVLLVFLPPPRQGSVSVTFVGLSNNAAGGRVALFSARNSTDRLVVRGRSELESRGETSNVLSVVQIRDVDYLRPRQTIDFAIPCAQVTPWRLRFYYIGQLHRGEQLRSGLGWSLERAGIVPERWSSMSWVPRNPVYDVATEWVSDVRSNRVGGGIAPGIAPPASRTNVDAGPHHSLWVSPQSGPVFSPKGPLPRLLGERTLSEK